MMQMLKTTGICNIQTINCNEFKQGLYLSGKALFIYRDWNI